MQATPAPARSGSPVAVGIILVLVGVAALALQATGTDLEEFVNRAGWPFFIIIPGLVLLTLAMIPAPPNGVGFAIAGSVVTTVGLILLYGDTTNDWDRWAYLWALIPASGGLAMTLYGLITSTRELAARGLRMLVIAGVVFLAAMWYFESTFATGQPPIDVDMFWPLIVIGIGGLITLSALFNPRATRRGFRRHRTNVDEATEV